MSGVGLSGGAATMALARLALVRAIRGKAVWVAVALVLLPVIITSVRVGLGHDRLEIWDIAFELTMLILPIVPSILVAPSLSEEIEDRTSAYLWSRALPRWSIVTGKLVGLAPVVAVVMVTALAIAWAILGGPASIPVATASRGLAAVLAAALVGSMVVLAIATLVPRHAVATSVVYLLFVDAVVGALPIKFQYISVAFAARAIAGIDPAGILTGVATLAGIAAFTSALAIHRIRTMEE